MNCFVRLMLCFSISIAGSIEVLADPGDTTRQEMPWKWTTEERLAVRFDVAQAAARSAASGCTDCVGKFVVHGRTDPQLLLPWELMTDLAGAFSGERHRLRRREIWLERAAGLRLPGHFWDLLYDMAGEYFDAENAQFKLIRQLPTVAGEDAARLRNQLSDLQRGLCPARADALAAARAKFGAETFDRFLYDAVAPGLIVIDTIRTAADHRWIEKGCR